MHAAKRSSMPSLAAKMNSSPNSFSNRWAVSRTHCLIAGSDSPEGRAQNRRMHITVQKQLAAAF
jgi:hypothetical protein